GAGALTATGAVPFALRTRGAFAFEATLRASGPFGALFLAGAAFFAFGARAGFLAFCAMAYFVVALIREAAMGSMYSTVSAVVLNPFRSRSCETNFSTTWGMVISVFAMMSL